MKRLLPWYKTFWYFKPSGFFKPLWHDAAKHLYKLLANSEYRSYFWLLGKYGATPRFRLRSVRTRSWRLTVPDMASFYSAYREIFVERIYAFPSPKKNPAILDCGANIGLSVLYFKTLFPGSVITAYEADPGIFRILEENMKENRVEGVELHNQAVWSSEGTVEFNVEGADGGRINAGHDQNVIAVPAVSLESILRQRTFDFVKIDIEGAETAALERSMPHLAQVPFVFVEFHSFHSKKQKLGKLIDDFERMGFRVHIHPPFTQKTPFLGLRESMGMDMQLNLFFWKDRHEAS